MLLRRRLIGSEMLSGDDGANINGPACIAAPTGSGQPKGRYYLYFAHHNGSYIRMAHADHPAGPWTIHAGGVLHLDQVPGCRDHIASPDVVRDPDNGGIRMYFHGVESGGNRQMTYLAHSPDGLRFTVLPQPIAPYYLRVTQWRDLWIGMSKGGQILVSRDGRSNFQLLPAPAFAMSDPQANNPGSVRHVALDVEGDRLWVYFTRIGDAPEHIRLGYVDLLRAPGQWRVEDSVEVIRPAEEWEGAGLPGVPSRSGPMHGAENALRDPAILNTGSERWLFYSFAGESGIGATKLPDPVALYRERPKQSHIVANEAANQQKRIQDLLGQLQQPGALARRLAQMDANRRRKRLFLMGSGRSGTWLLTAMMACFADTEVVAREAIVELFGLIESPRSTIVLKRAWNSYERVGSIPEGIGLIFLVRNPFDVLTSHNPTTMRKRHISPERWLGEMRAMKQVLESGRPDVLVVRYEDMVADPQAVMARIAAMYGLVQERDPADAPREARLPDEAVAAMHGVRPIDRASVLRYRANPDDMAYLREIVPLLGDMLPWMAERFGYDPVP